VLKEEEQSDEILGKHYCDANRGESKVVKEKREYIVVRQ
jgi:hypothetical protein